MNQTNTQQNTVTEAISLCLEAYHALLFGQFREWFATKYSQTRTVSDDFPARDENGKLIEVKKGSFGFSFQSSKSNAEAYFSSIVVPEDYILMSCDLVLSEKTTIKTTGEKTDTIQVQLELQKMQDPKSTIILIFQLMEEENDGKWPNLHFVKSDAIICTEKNSTHGPEGKTLVLLWKNAIIPPSKTIRFTRQYIPLFMGDFLIYKKGVISNG